MNRKQRKKDLVNRAFELVEKLDKIAATQKPLLEEQKEVHNEIIKIMIDEGEASFNDLDGRGMITLKIPEFGILTDKKAFFLYLMERGDNAIAKVQLGPEAITPAILKRIKMANDDNVDIKIHAGTFQAYLRNSHVDVINTETWPPGIKMEVGAPKLKIKPAKK